MYPDLSYLFHDLFGSSYDNGFSVFKTYGMFLVFAFIGAGYVMRKEMERKGNEGIYTFKEQTKIIRSGFHWTPFLTQGLYGFILGTKLVYIYYHFDALKANAAAVIFSMKGHLWGGIIGMVGALALYAIENKGFAARKSRSVTQKVWPHDRLMTIVVIAAIAGVVGARLFAISENFDAFLHNPVDQLISSGGLTIYGGLITAFLACSMYLSYHNIPLLPTWDAAAPALFVGYGIGRLGCQISGDGDWGIVNNRPVPDWFILPDWLWAYDYPHNISNKGQLIVDCVAKYCHHLTPPVYPTPLYETIMAFTLFFILWRLRKKIKIPGLIFSLYLIFNGVERFLIEFVRVNEQYSVGPFYLSQAQFIAVGLMVVGILFTTVLYYRSKVSNQNT